MRIKCRNCSKPTDAVRKTKRWCDSCRYLPYRGKKRPKRNCRWCRTPFVVKTRSHADRGKRYCCEEHARLAAIKSKNDSRTRRRRGEPLRTTGRPRKYSKEESDRRRKLGRRDRFFLRHPERKRVCEARGCGEDRVIELAHKKSRRGAGMTMANTRSEDVWVLCPTCHRCLDLGIQTAEELGLH